MTIYTFKQNNRATAASRCPSPEIESSWKIIWSGEVCCDKEARDAVDKLSKWYRNVRVYRGCETKPHYAVYQM